MRRAGTRVCGKRTAWYISASHVLPSGEGGGDDETIHINLPMLPPHIEKLAVVINAYEKPHRHTRSAKKSSNGIQVQ
jgi:stress response protein SCP2